MATNKGSGSRRAISLISRRPSPYTLVLEHSASLNRAFDLVLEEVAWLSKMGFFWGEISRRFMKTCRLSVEELRTWAMAEVTQDLLERAGADWGRYGVQRFRWEEKFRDPQDVLKQAERVKKHMGEQAQKKRPKRA
jgi:hypothetical protein